MRQALVRQAPGTSTFLWCLPLLLFGPLWLGAKAKPTEYEVKAAFLYQFVNFVEWPDDDDELRLCILGQDPFGSYLDAIETRQAKGRTISLNRLGHAEEADRCHLIFVASAPERPAQELLADLPKTGVLIVGDSKDFVSHGGTIGFVFKGGRVGFELNLKVAREAGLRVSSKLLEVAKVVVL